MVYILEPSSLKFRWERVGAGSQLLYKKSERGEPVLRSDLPAEIVLDGKFKLPDICEPTSGLIFVSEKARAVLEALAPDCISFLPLVVNAPVYMNPLGPYFHVDVIARSKTVDWHQSVTRPRIVKGPEGKESRSLKGGFRGGSVKFRPLTSRDPPIWRETDCEEAEVHFFAVKMDILMCDKLWIALNEMFVDQLRPVKIA